MRRKCVSLPAGGQSVWRARATRALRGTSLGSLHSYRSLPDEVLNLQGAGTVPHGRCMKDMQRRKDAEVAGELVSPGSLRLSGSGRCQGYNCERVMATISSLSLPGSRFFFVFFLCSGNCGIVSHGEGIRSDSIPKAVMRRVVFATLGE